MSTSPSRPTRAQLEEAGFEALQRLFAEAVTNEKNVALVCARVLVGLYNGQRFPLDLTDLRVLPDDLFEDAMAAIRMDARVTRQEVHAYFERGGRRFEELVRDHAIEDVVRLKATGDGSPRPHAKRGVLCHGDHVSATVVSCADAPGYRDVTLTLDCEVVGDLRQDIGSVRLEVNLGVQDSETVLRHIGGVHSFAWSQEKPQPLDARPGETRPTWLDKPVSWFYED